MGELLYIALARTDLICQTQKWLGASQGLARQRLWPSWVDAGASEDKVVYGITTGFGKFARTKIETGKLV